MALATAIKKKFEPVCNDDKVFLKSQISIKIEIETLKRYWFHCALPLSFLRQK